MRLGALLMDHVVRPLVRAFAVYGSIYVTVPTGDPAADSRGLDGPPPRHPERLCPELPLSAVELALAAQLVDPFPRRAVFPY